MHTYHKVYVLLESVISNVSHQDMFRVVVTGSLSLYERPRDTQGMGKYMQRPHETITSTAVIMPLGHVRVSSLDKGSPRPVGSFKDVCRASHGVQ